MKETINCILFDGDNLIENASVTIDEGKIVSIERSNSNCSNYFMMPCLIDSHTHMINVDQVNKMITYGVNTTFDVCASQALIESSKVLRIISSLDMAMGIVLNPKKFIEKAISKGAKYIKVLLFNSLSIGLKALKGIVEEAHKNNLKVVVHATELATYKQVVEANVDIILHLPMKDKLSDDFASEIASKGIYVVPTLVMMETFVKCGRGGYNEEHFKNALKQVKTLRDNGVKILVGTDANIGSFAPEVTYGDSVYREINLLLEAGIPLLEVLKGATSRNGEAFNLNLGKIEIGNTADALLFKKSEDIEISYDKLEKVWISGKEIK